MHFKKLSPYLLPLIPILGLFLGWQLFANAGIIEFSLFSDPTTILTRLYELRLTVVDNISVTLFRLVFSFIIALVIGIGIGVLIGINRYIYRFFDPLITTVMPIPGIAMAPLFIVWFGFGNPTIITIGIIVAFFPVMYNTAAGVRGIDKNFIHAAEIMGANRKKIFTSVLLPAAAPYLLTGVRLGLARCWRTIIAVEFIAAANQGIGYMIWDAYEYLRVSVVYGGIIILAIIFFVIEKVIVEMIERNTIRKWGMVNR